MRAIDVQQFIEQRPIVDDRLTHLFGPSCSLLPPQRQGASGAVILNNYRVVYRDVVRTPIEIFERITTRRHDLRHAPIVPSAVA